MIETSDARGLPDRMARVPRRRWVTLLTALALFIAAATAAVGTAGPASAAVGPISWYCSQVTETPHAGGSSIEFRGHINCNSEMFNRVEMTVIAYRDGSIVSQRTTTCYYPTVGYCFANLWVSDPAGDQRYCNYVSSWVWLKNGASGSFQGKSCEDWTTP